MGLLSGILVTGLGGASAGALSWPMKLMKKYDFEQCWFSGMLFGLFILPWAVTLIFCPNAIEAYRSVDPALILKSNLFSLAWGIGNVLLGVSLVRIGASLSFAILSGVGVPLGVIVPMIFKGSGKFQEAADLNSPAGYTILVATALMLVGVVFVALAGFGRDKMLDKKAETSGGFLGGLIMCVVSGFCSVGPSFAFVYSQGPVREAMLERGAGEWPASVSVWALGMFLGGLVNLVYPAILMTRRRSWHVVKEDELNIGGLLHCIVRPVGTPPIRFCERGSRSIDEIPPSELLVVASITEMTNQFPRASDEHLRAILDFYGLSRLTNNARTTIEKYLTLRLQSVDDFLRELVE